MGAGCFIFIFFTQKSPKFANNHQKFQKSAKTFLELNKKEKCGEFSDICFLRAWQACFQFSNKIYKQFIKQFFRIFQDLRDLADLHRTCSRFTKIYQFSQAPIFPGSRTNLPIVPISPIVPPLPLFQVWSRFFSLSCWSRPIWQSSRWLSYFS